MNMILFITLITLISGVVGTGIGGLVGIVIKRDSTKIVSLLLSFAGGVMLGIVCFSLLTDAFNEADLTWKKFVAILSIILGYLLVWGLNHIIDKKTNHEVKHIDENHPKTADDLDELIHSNHLEVHKSNKSSLIIAGMVMVCAIALHNFPEGMVIGASYVNSDSTTVFSGAGFFIAIVIGLHNIPEGMAVSVPLISGGTNKAKAVLLAALSGFPTVIGALFGYLIGSIDPIVLSMSLGFASGAMLYVVFGELLPESILVWKSKIPAFFVFIGLIVGVLISIM